MKNKFTGNDIATGLQIFENFNCRHRWRYWMMFLDKSGLRR